MLGLTYDAQFLQISQGLFVYDVLFFGMMAFYIAGTGFKVKVMIPRPWLYLSGLFILAHLTTIIVTFVIGYPNLDMETVIFIKFLYLFSLMVFASLIVDDRLVEDAFWYFAVGVIAVAAFGLYQVSHATGGHLLAGHYYRIAHHDEGLLNANTLTIQTSIGGTIVLMFFIKERSVLKKWGVYLPAFLFLMGVTFFTFSKGGWTGFALGTVVSLALCVKRIGFLRLGASCLVLAATVYFALVKIPFLEYLPAAIGHRLSEGQMTGSFQRVDYFYDVFVLLFMEPVVVLLSGAGFKNYTYMVHEKYQFFAPGDNPHNLLSYLFFGTGFTGAFLVIALFASILWTIFKCRRACVRLEGRGGQRALYVNMFISWLIVSIWFSLISAYPIFHHTFWVFTGIAGRYMHDLIKMKQSSPNASRGAESGLGPVTR